MGIRNISSWCLCVLCMGKLLLSLSSNYSVNCAHLGTVSNSSRRHCHDWSGPDKCIDGVTIRSRSNCINSFHVLLDLFSYQPFCFRYLSQKNHPKNHTAFTVTCHSTHQWTWLMYCSTIFVASLLVFLRDTLHPAIKEPAKCWACSLRSYSLVQLSCSKTQSCLISSNSEEEL